MKPAEIQRHFSEPIKNPALRSHLTILVTKGHVSRRKIGKAFFYKALTRQRSAFRAMLRDFVDGYCGGSLQAFLLNVIEAEKLSVGDLAALQRLADEPVARPRSSSRRRRRQR